MDDFPSTEQMRQEVVDKLASLNDEERFELLVNSMSSVIATLEDSSSMPVFIRNQKTLPQLMGVAHEFLKALPVDDQLITAARLISTGFLAGLESEGLIVDMITGFDATNN